MIGLGTQDNLEMANDFVDEFGITHTLLWDESFQSWAELGVSLQPSAQLYAADGTLLREWLGPFNEDEVLELLAGNEVAASEGPASSDAFCRFTDRFAQAQRVAVEYPDADRAGRQRILDDLRYAANAMAQMATSALSGPAERLAEAVRDHSQVFLDADLASDPATVAGRDTSAAQYVAAIQGIAEISVELCGVSLEPTAAP